MGSTRFRLGSGWTIGASGLRYGRSIPGLRRGYVSVGRSGTLITGAGVRHWQGSKRGSRGAPAQSLTRRQRNTAGWARLGIGPRVANVLCLAVVALVVGVVWDVYHTQALNHAADQASGLAAARAAGAPGICLDDNVWNSGNVGGMTDGHYYWRISAGDCGPGEHFVPVK